MVDEWKKIAFLKLGKVRHANQVRKLVKQTKPLINLTFRWNQRNFTTLSIQPRTRQGIKCFTMFMAMSPSPPNVNAYEKHKFYALCSLFCYIMLFAIKSYADNPSPPSPPPPTVVQCKQTPILASQNSKSSTKINQFNVGRFYVIKMVSLMKKLVTFIFGLLLLRAEKQMMMMNIPPILPTHFTARDLFIKNFMASFNHSTLMMWESFINF